jgi:hypothetical protein
MEWDGVHMKKNLFLIALLLAGCGGNAPRSCDPNDKLVAGCVAVDNNGSEYLCALPDGAGAFLCSQGDTCVLNGGFGGGPAECAPSCPHDCFLRACTGDPLLC